MRPSSAHNKMTPSGEGLGSGEINLGSGLLDQKWPEILARVLFSARILTMKFGPNFFLYFQEAQIYTVKIGPNFGPFLYFIVQFWPNFYSTNSGHLKMKEKYSAHIL